QIRLPRAGGTDQQDVRLRDLDLGFVSTEGLRLLPRLQGADALVMVVDGDGQCLLRRFLTDDVFLQEVEDLTRLRQCAYGLRRTGFAELLFDDLSAQPHAFLGDVNTWAGDELPNLLRGLPTEVAFDQVFSVRPASHCHNLSPGR